MERATTAGGKTVSMGARRGRVGGRARVEEGRRGELEKDEAGVVGATEAADVVRGLWDTPWRSVLPAADEDSRVLPVEASLPAALYL